MTEPRIRRDHLAFAGAVLSAAAAGLAVVAYMVRRLQFGLYGLPPEVDTDLLSLANAAVSLLAGTAIEAVLVCAPMAGLAWLTARQLRRAGWTAGGAAPPWWGTLLVGAGVAAALLLPAAGLSKVYGVLWKVGVAPKSIEAGMLALVIGDHPWARWVAGGLGLGAAGLAVTVATHLAGAWWHRRGAARLANAFAAGVVAVAAMTSLLVLLAGTQSELGNESPVVTIQLRATAMPNHVTATGLMLTPGTGPVAILPTAPDAAAAYLIPKDSIARIDFAGRAEPATALLCRRLECPQMTVTIGRIPFRYWAITTAILLTLGFVLVMLPAAAAADSDARSEPPPLSPTELASARAFFPQVTQSADDLARTVEMFVGMLKRGSGESVADLWLRKADGTLSRLTTGGGYSSPRPSRECGQVAYLRHGHPGILDVATGSAQALPGDAVYDRLYGWDEAAGLLLAARGDGTLVHIHVADGGAEPVAPAPMTREQRGGFEALARMTPAPGLLLVVKAAGKWAVMEKQWGVEDNRRLVTAAHPLADPAWCAAGTVYVAAGE